jgi:hypothetical protein
MMKVRILHDLPTTIDGKKIGPFSAGQEVELDDALAAVFIGSAMAEEVLPEPEPEEQDGSVHLIIGDGTGAALPEVENYDGLPLQTLTSEGIPTMVIDPAATQRTRRKKAH